LTAQKTKKEAENRGSGYEKKKHKNIMILKHSKNNKSILSSEMPLDAPATKRLVLPMDSFGGQPP